MKKKKKKKERRAWENLKDNLNNSLNGIGFGLLVYLNLFLDKGLGENKNNLLRYVKKGETTKQRHFKLQKRFRCLK